MRKQSTVLNFFFFFKIIFVCTHNKIIVRNRCWNSLTTLNMTNVTLKKKKFRDLVRLCNEMCQVALLYVEKEKAIRKKFWNSADWLKKVSIQSRDVLSGRFFLLLLLEPFCT